MIAIGSDHGGYDLKHVIIKYFEEQGLEYKDYGCYDKSSCDYPVFGKAAAQAVADGECDKGIVICQAHAPFARGKDDEEKIERRFGDIVQGMRNASYLGAPMIVVHPCCHLDYSSDGNAERLFEFNYNFYSRLIPYAEEFDIKIAIENIGRQSVTSTPERLNRLYDALNNPAFTVCFDVGHCLFQGVDPADAIRAIGDRLVHGCTHVHDNSGDKDEHTLPFYGNVNWESVMKALANIGYMGELNYEASGFIKDVPPELRPDGLRYMAKVGHYLISRFLYYRANM